MKEYIPPIRCLAIIADEHHQIGTRTPRMIECNRPMAPTAPDLYCCPLGHTRRLTDADKGMTQFWEGER